MRLSYSVAAAALLGCAGMTLAQAPANSPQLVPVAPGQAAPAAGPGAAPAPTNGPDGAPANCQNMMVDNYGTPVNKCYFGLDYILWTLRETPLQTFGASVPVSFTIVNTVGNVVQARVVTATIGVVPSALGEVEGEDLNRNGGRFHIGFWCGEGTAVEASFFGLEQLNFAAGFAGRTTASFTTGFTGAPATLTAAIAVNGSGFEKVDLWGAEVNCRKRCLVIGCFSVDALCGLRYIDLDEIAGTTGAASLALVNPPATVTTSLPTAFPFFSSMATTNRVFLGQIGLQSQLDLGCICISSWVKAGVGADDESGKLFSGTIVPGSTTVGRTQMDLLGEWDINAGWQINNYIRASVGYNFLYLKNVVRPGNSLTDTGAAISVNTISAPAGAASVLQPAMRLRDDKFFAHGLTAGLEFRY
jgi:hypothetical protein